MKQYYDKFIVAVIAISLAGLMSFIFLHRLGREDELPENHDHVVILQNTDGEYSCKLGDAMSRYNHATYEEAKTFCDEWRESWLKYLARKDQKWTPVEESRR